VFRKTSLCNKLGLGEVPKVEGQMNGREKKSRGGKNKKNREDDIMERFSQGERSSSSF